MANESEGLFEQATNPSDSFLERYVGEGKKYRDVEELAKAYDNANRHIPELTEDLKSMKEFVAAQFAELGKRKEIPGEPPEPAKAKEQEPVAAPKVDGEDLNTRILKALEERDETTRLQTNAQIAQEVMIEHFGTQEAAVEAVRQKATELGVNPQFLADTAFRSPKALFNIMGINPDEKPRSANSPAPSPDVNTRVLDKTLAAKPGTYSYYDQLRKADPKKYWEQSTQNQLMKDALAAGPDFFKRN